MFLNDVQWQILLEECFTDLNFSVLNIWQCSPCREHEIKVQNFLNNLFFFCGCVLIIACSSFAIQINDITLNSRWLSCSRESEASQGNIFLYRGLGDSKPPRFQEETEDTWNLYLLCAIELCLLYGPCCLTNRSSVLKPNYFLEVLTLSFVDS